MKATTVQVRELANAIAQQAESIAAMPDDLPEYLLRASVTRIKGNIDTLAAWTAE